LRQNAEPQLAAEIEGVKSELKRLEKAEGGR
jgi:hypothetical protein